MTGKEEEVRRGPPSQGKEMPSGEGGRPAELSPGPPPNPGFPGREIHTVRLSIASVWLSVREDQKAAVA